MPAETYAEVVDSNRRALARARLADPAEHFPYKHAAVTAMLDDGTVMGPGIPGQLDGTEDDTRTIDDYMSPGIADASRDYVEAQAAFLEDPSDANRDAYNAARDQLQAARLDHRRGREGFVVGAVTRRAG
jgi:hypothetical protein